MHTDPAHDHTSPRRRQRVTYHTLQEGWRILDFLSHHPESCHILTWLLDGALLTSTALSAPSFSTACRCMCNQHSGFAWVVKRAPNTETLLRRHRHPEELPPDARLWRAHVQDDQRGGQRDVRQVPLEDAAGARWPCLLLLDSGWRKHSGRRECLLLLSALGVLGQNLSCSTSPAPPVTGSVKWLPVLNECPVHSASDVTSTNTMPDELTLTVSSMCPQPCHLVPSYPSRNFTF